MIDSEEIKKILQCVQKPGRYSGGEWNAVKKDHRLVRAKIALAFPDLYEIGMSYLGQKILYGILNSRKDIIAERVFAPWVDLENELRQRRIPLFSLENRIPLFEFDMIGFSLLYELNFTNILTILDLGQIPPLAADRNLSHPLIIAGGPAAFNPEPVADLFDLLLIGDGEEAFLEIIERYDLLRQESASKPEILRDLAGIKGVYIPSFYAPYIPRKSRLQAVKPKDKAPESVSKRILFPFRETIFPEEVIVPNTRVIFDRVAVEIARGCPQRCRFCQATSIYFPPRERNPDFVVNKVVHSLISTGYESASLAALSVSDYSCLEEVVDVLMQRLKEQNVSLSLPSLRPKGLTPHLAENILQVRKTGFTLVPEAGTERLRRVINKPFEDQDLLDAARSAFSKGWSLLKLYFMVGLPTETEEDVVRIAGLVEEIIRLGKTTLKKPPRINLSVSSFIPKPHTPFQWLGLEAEDVLRERHNILRSRLRRYPWVKLKESSLEGTWLEAVFSRGDRRLNGVLRRAWRKGARFESWNEHFDLSVWKTSFEEEGLDAQAYLSAFDRNAVLPWEHIDTGLKKAHLLRELDKALREQATASCHQRLCAECQGCTLWPGTAAGVGANPDIRSPDQPALGTQSDSIVRYRVTYAKRDEARYISHIDLISTLQRAFRRAGVPIEFTKGYHPKMSMTFSPALPLGMEGWSEILEFKSTFSFSEEEFITRMNSVLPRGVKVLSLARLTASRPRLSAEIDVLVYSVDLENPLVREQPELRGGEDERREHATRWASVGMAIDEFMNRGKISGVDKISLDRKKKKMILRLKYSPQKTVRLQDVIKHVIGRELPVFAITREQIILKQMP